MPTGSPRRRGLRHFGQAHRRRTHHPARAGASVVAPFPTPRALVAEPTRSLMGLAARFARYAGNGLLARSLLGAPFTFRLLLPASLLCSTMRVGLFVPCYVDQLAPSVAEATVTVLERAGCTVEYDPDQTCCGQPFANLGLADEARRLARAPLERFARWDAVVSPPPGRGRTRGRARTTARSVRARIRPGGACARGPSS